SVIYAGTFSKCLSPGLRIGFGVLPRHLVDPVCALKGNIDFGTAQLNQMLLANLLELGLLEPHITQIRQRYQQKLAVTLDALAEHFADTVDVRWHRPTGGLYVWLTLPDGVSAGLDSPLFASALEQQMLYVPGEFCYAPEGVAARASTIRLCFGVADEAQIRRGVAALAAALKHTVITRKERP
ncbi:MAG: aminotransferase class I/II-fold pyridoxal phosphate-dependent enzyme, partial [Pirellulales bacterium]